MGEFRLMASENLPSCLDGVSKVGIDRHIAFCTLALRVRLSGHMTPA